MELTAQQLGLNSVGRIYRNLDFDSLYTQELEKGETVITSTGTMMVDTGAFTGRSPKDKYFVQQSPSADQIAWGPINKPISPEIFEKLYRSALDYLSSKDLYVTDGYCGANPKTRQQVRFVTEFAWQSHFCKNMFIRPEENELQSFAPDFTVYNASNLTNPDWEGQGLNSEVFVLINLEERVAVIGGTWYGGEMKKGLFTVMNYLLPQQDVLPMHCSANIGKQGDVCIFFGLSGTGKTTLSTDSRRRLIGDDEHGWDDQGVFNFEGGCYAKVINLDSQSEPEIYQAIRRNALLENVVANGEGLVDYSDGSKTENTRVSYPIDHIDNHEESLMGGHPENIIFLTCDAFGVLPPVSLLTPEQAMYYFLSGYTAKVAGTERGITEPQAAFSACFGEAFLPLHPTVYARLLGQKMAQHKTQAFLVNTGWSGGGYGVGSRMKIKLTRSCINAILTGSIRQVPTEVLPIFNLTIPSELAEVPSDILNPRNLWPDKATYDTSATKLAEMFQANFKKYGSDEATLKIATAGPASV